MSRTDARHVAALSSLFVVLVLAVDPRGDFPQNDDWAFAESAFALAAEGRLAFTGWQSMPLVTHTLWGGLFAAVGGASFGALRASTLCLALGAVLATYGLARTAGAAPAGASLAAVTLLANPWFLGLSFTFMSDVPFLALLLAATFAWALGLAPGRPVACGLGVGLTVLATLSRQNGLALPIAATLVSPVSPRPWTELRKALTGTLLAFACLASIEIAIDATVGLPHFYSDKTHALGGALRDAVTFRGWPHFAERMLACWLYAGLLLFPVALALPSSSSRTRRLGLGLCATIVAALLAGTRFEMPMLGNVWTGWGLGPWLGPGDAPSVPASLPFALTLLSCLGLGLLLDSIAAFDSARWSPAALLVLAVGVVAGVGPVLVSYAPFLDRYLLPLVPFAAAALMAALGPRSGYPVPTASFLAAGVLAASSAIGVHDHLAWQRTRWQALDGLLAAGVPRNQITGGFELDNARPRLDPTTLPVPGGRRLFLIATSPVGGYRTLVELPVPAWASGPRRVFVLEARARQPAARPQAADILSAMRAQSAGGAAVSAGR